MIVIATTAELELVNKVLGEKAYEHFPILVTGVGGANVCMRLRDIPRDTPILNIGYAGSADTPIGTQVEVKTCKVYHPNVTYNEPTFELSDHGKLCLTSNDFVLETKEHDCVFDMELAYICALGFTDIRSIKVVSDNLSLHQYDKTTGDDDVTSK